MKSTSVVRNKGEIRLCRDAQDVGRQAAALFAEVFEDSVKRHGKFLVALSGGSTPALMYRQLAGPDFRDRLPWAQGEYFWSDERCVPPDHPDSNYGLAERTLISKVPIPRERVHRMRGEEDPERAAAEYEQELRRLFEVAPPELPRFDLLLLGMGDDGHTASLFPGSPALDENSRLVAANYVRKINGYRLTLTFPAINAARTVAFLVSGEKKAPALRQVMRGGSTPVPAASVHPKDGRSIWFVDEAAAAQLE